MAPGQVFSSQFAPLSEADRARSLKGALGLRPRPGRGLWLFAYGSLMWKPGFAHGRAEPARLDGWHRAMCVWTVLARGTPAGPGLSLGLMPGGTCTGLALCIDEAAIDTALATLWQREMWTDVYHPTWAPVTIGTQEITALAFTVNRESRQFAGGVAPARIVEHIAEATGQRGSCRDYLAQTVEKLRALRIHDPDLEALAEAVMELGEKPESGCSTAAR